MVSTLRAETGLCGNIMSRFALLSDARAGPDAYWYLTSLAPFRALIMDHLLHSLGLGQHP